MKLPNTMTMDEAIGAMELHHNHPNSFQQNSFMRIIMSYWWLLFNDRSPHYQRMGGHITLAKETRIQITITMSMIQRLVS
jgi:hypothetical protein